MISEFLESWELFQYSYLAGAFVALQLSLVGVLVIAKGQIFIGAALSQASTLGIAVSMWLAELTIFSSLHFLHTDMFTIIMAITFAIATALIAEQSHRQKQANPEAITGWIFLFTSSLAILIMAQSPHGTAEIQRLTSSSIIGASSLDVWIFVTLFIVTIASLIPCHRRLMLYVMDTQMATAVGIKTVLWGLLNSAWLGLSIGLSIHITGMLYSFACLILPALIAKNMSRELKPIFFLAPCIVLITVATSFVLANHYDYPPAQLTVALLCLLLLLAWCLQKILSLFITKKS